MLAGLKFGKKEEEKADKGDKALSKKEKKKEKRKEQKKRKKAKKDKKNEKEDVSEALSNAQESDEEEKAKPKDSVTAKPKVNQVQSTGDEEVAKAEVDFFGSMGKEREKDAELKEDPDKVKVSEKEYNPFLRGEESNLPVPQSASASSIPEHLRVGPAWAKNDWRKRLNKRQADSNRNDEAKPRSSPPRRRTEQDEPYKKTGDAVRSRSNRWRVESCKESSHSPFPKPRQAQPKPKQKPQAQPKAQRFPQAAEGKV